MQLFVKYPNATSVTYNIEASASVESLKEAISTQENADISSLKLLCNNFLLSEGRTLAECGVDECSTVHVCLDLMGGKKRKKKVYTKPKRIPHKNKKIKLAVLKYYKVDGDKVQRLRKVCPNEMCGPGVFMANHQNRSYCGKCGITYVIKKD